MWWLVLVFTIAIIGVILYYYYSKSVSKSKPQSTGGPRIKAYIINMDKNKDRMKFTTENYEKSDMKIVPWKRFPAVIGKNVDINEWLTDEAIVELKQVENKKYRNYHYQLTRGGIGCFLSHYNLAKQLLADQTADYYLNLEDDIQIRKDGYKILQEALKNAPEDWDFILFGYIRLLYSDIKNDNFALVSGFWGCHGMLMNKKGAKALVDEVETTKIDGQIDAYMSRMTQQKKLVVYAYSDQIFHQSNTITISDIQVPLNIRADTDPFNYRGYKV